MTRGPIRPYPVAHRGGAAILLATVLLAGCATGGGDFNGDGQSDLAIGVPFRDIGEARDAGAVALVYGAGSGATNSTLLARVAPGQEPAEGALRAVARDSDRLGATLATGDFDSDGFADLAIGVPYEDVRGLRDAGAVEVLYGSADGGLDAAHSELWTQEKTGVEGGAEANDLFGYALATGDFNNDGVTDLAVGVPFNNIGTIVNAGAVNIIFGSLAGLSAERNQILDQVQLGIRVEQNNAQFGATLAAGDFDGDGNTDLAVGAPEESVVRQQQAGAVNVVYGSTGGLDPRRYQEWKQHDRFIMGGDNANTADRFGSALAAGDFNGDGISDLAIGTPFDDWGDHVDSGTVNVLYGRRGFGLNGDRDQIWHQNVRGTNLANEDQNRYGAALTAGDFNGDGFADLAIGVPGYMIEGKKRAGVVLTLYGSDAGLTPNGNQNWRANSAGLGGTPEEAAEFGYALMSNDLNGDGIDDLAVGAKDNGGTGAVYLLYGSGAGLQGGGAPLRLEGLGGSAQPEELFGAALSSAVGHGASE